jgi:hypothetical protein
MLEEKKICFRFIMDQKTPFTESVIENNADKNVHYGQEL